MTERKPIRSLELVESVLVGEVAAIARLLTRAEYGDEEVHDALAEIYRHTGKAMVAGVTGVSGSGKSTLLQRLVSAIRNDNRTVAVVAVDPTSPFSGGAILGDRIRMHGFVNDPGVFIRSMATRGALGGLARATLDAVDILDAAGFDIVLIETVGVGQDEIDVVRAAHTTVVVSAPGLGDDIQAIKAGILEIADIHAVSKCDRKDANKTLADLKNMLAISALSQQQSGWSLPVVATSALEGQGTEELLGHIDNHFAFLESSGELAARRWRIAEWRLLQTTEELLRGEFVNHRDGRLSIFTRQLVSRETSPRAAAKELIDNVLKENQS